MASKIKVRPIEAIKARIAARSAEHVDLTTLKRFLNTILQSAEDGGRRVAVAGRDASKPLYWVAGITHYDDVIPVAVDVSISDFRKRFSDWMNFIDYENSAVSLSVNGETIGVIYRRTSSTKGMKDLKQYAPVPLRKKPVRSRTAREVAALRVQLAGFETRMQDVPLETNIIYRRTRDTFREENPPTGARVAIFEARPN